MRALVAVVAIAGVLTVVGCAGSDAQPGSPSPAASSPVESPSVPADNDAGLDSEPEPSEDKTPLATTRLGNPHPNGSFEVTVTKVSVGVKELAVDETARSGGIKNHKPENGQFIVVYVTAKNIGKKPAVMSVTDSELTDVNGKTYGAGGPYLFGVVGQDLDSARQQPDTTRKGFIAFDVPPSAGKPSTVTIQSDAYMATTNEPVTVSLG